MLANPGSELLKTVPLTGLEKSMADADAERLVELAAELIIDVWDPYRIPFRLLPYLAWAMGVNYWDDHWRETTKRAWTARQWEFKAIRGTLAGARMAIDYAGRDVSPFGYQLLSAITPPQRVFSGPSLTKSEREAWLVSMPQLRVWRIQERGIAGEWKSFYGGNGGLRQRNHRFCLDGGGGPTPSTALSRLHRRARWIVNGVETDTTVTEFGSYWQVHLRGKAGYKVFSNMPMRPNRFYIPSDAWKRLITIAPKPILPWRSTIKSSMEPVTAEPERVVINGTRGYSAFCNTPMRYRAYYIPTTAPLRIFERYAIYAGAGRLTKRTPIQFMGVGRYGFPKFTAWLRVSLRNKRSKFAAGEGIILPKAKFWIPHDDTPIQRARAATVASKRLVDAIKLDTGPVHRFVAGRPFIAGVDSLIVGRP